MAQIRPFRGVLYNPHKIKDLARVLTEPYDVITPTQQRNYYKLHPNNIIRLILGRPRPTDTARDNPYTRARSYLKNWQRQGILLRDKKESIYIYTQQFSQNNRKKTRTGFIVLLKLEDLGRNTILPHEHTRTHAVEDRLKLLEATSANLSPIFALFSDPQRRINRILHQYKRLHRPCIVVQKENVLHKLWRMGDQRKIKAIKQFIRDKQIFIADGHHRYEAAQTYKLKKQKNLKRKRTGALFNYVMTYLTATDDPGLTILPTHRVLKIAVNFNLQRVLEELKVFFKMHRFSSAEKLFSYLTCNRVRVNILGAYFGKNRFGSLQLKDVRPVHRFIGQDKKSPLRNSAISILHSLIIKHILNIRSSGNIYYTPDAQEAIELVDKDKYQIAFFLPSTTVAQLKRAAIAGERLPPKSTYFYPKLLTGLVINVF